MRVLQKTGYKVLIHLLENNADKIIKQLEKKIEDYFSIYKQDERLYRDMREKALPEAERMFWQDIASKFPQIAIQEG